jgi:hypothetical protein
MTIQIDSPDRVEKTELGANLQLLTEALVNALPTKHFYLLIDGIVQPIASADCVQGKHEIEKRK